MNAHDLITFLDRYGHLRNPFGEARSIPDIAGLTVDSQVVTEALQSYQAMHALPLELIGRGIFQLQTAASGRLDKPTVKLIETARCACPDYAGATEQAGVGNWKGCNGVGNFHCVNVHFLTAWPSHLVGLRDQIWNRVVDSFAEVGLLVTNDTTRPSNIDIRFVKPNGQWIGLAELGYNQTCGGKLQTWFDQDYSPANLISEITTLIKHEILHNCGFGHTASGVLNSYIISGLPVSFVGDVIYPQLVKSFGGVPFPRTPKEAVLVLAWKRGNDFEVLQTLDTNKPPGGIFPK